MKPHPSLPDVEPLSEARWNRIEREIFDGLDATGPVERAPARPASSFGRRSMLAAAGIAAAAAVVTFFGVKNFGNERAQTLSHVETGAGESTLTLGESTVKVERESAMLVGGDAKSGVLLVLDRGGITCDVAPRAGRPPFIVQAGNVRVRVVGTRFQVGRAGTNVSVHVDHGMVEVTANGKPQMLRDGDTFSSEPKLVENTPAPSAAPSDPIPTNDLEVVPGNGTGTLVKRPRTTPSAKPSGIVRSPDFAEPAPTAVTPRDDYERAARLERSDPEGASSIYRRLAAGSGTWAANALFALARLESSRGQRDAAKRHAEEYLTRYPTGLNAADARDLVNKLR